jgi:hypothetical protein
VIVGVARACPPFTLGFDVFEPVTEVMLQEATAKGLKFAGRYLENLTVAEVGLLFRYGFGILPYTEAMTKTPLSVATGLARGELACAQGDGVGCPPLVHIGIDLELPAEGSDCEGHIDAMSDALLAKNRGAALYVGDPQPLTGSQLFQRRPNRYIKGGGRVAEPLCGWAALQLEPLEGMILAGVKVDVEVSKLDYQGRALVLWWPQ